MLLRVLWLLLVVMTSSKEDPKSRDRLARRVSCRSCLSCCVARTIGTALENFDRQQTADSSTQHSQHHSLQSVTNTIRGYIVSLEAAEARRDPSIHPHSKSSCCLQFSASAQAHYLLPNQYYHHQINILYQHFTGWLYHHCQC